MTTKSALLALVDEWRATWGSPNHTGAAQNTYRTCADALSAIISELREGVEKCGCETCRPQSLSDMRMILCAICGNKRCPHATDHRNACTNSNATGQPGSSYAPPPAAQGLTEGEREAIKRLELGWNVDYGNDIPMLCAALRRLAPVKPPMDYGELATTIDAALAKTGCKRLTADQRSIVVGTVAGYLM